MEVEHALRLDERVGTHGVIAGRKRRELDLGPHLCKRLSDSTLPLVHVHKDLHRRCLRSSHRRILARAFDVHRQCRYAAQAASVAVGGELIADSLRTEPKQTRWFAQCPVRRPQEKRCNYAKRWAVEGSNLRPWD